MPWHQMFQPKAPRAPAPWSLTGHLYCFVHGTRSPSANPQHSENPDPSRRALMGGLGGILLFRYNTSPVGPYDELIIVPGAYGYQRPQQQAAGFSSFGSLSQYALRLLSRGTLACRPSSHQKTLSERSFGISQIYVSTEASVTNGRQNWSIPKQQAVFDWEQDTKTGITYVSVSLPAETSRHRFNAGKHSTSKPFLKASMKPLTPHLWLPRPLVPSIFRRILQPALPEQANLFNGEAGMGHEAAARMQTSSQEDEVRHSRFVSTKLDVSGQVALCKLDHIWTDGVEVPACDTLGLTRLGCSLKKVNLTFNVPDVYWLASLFDKKS